jgi:cytochrome c biogenesis protein CcdA
VIESLLSGAEQVIRSSPWLAPLLVFAGGLLTASNPCVLAMIPLAIAYVSGSKSVGSWKSGALFSLLFVSGLALTFAILGLIAAAAGRLLGDVGHFWKYIVLVVSVVMGAHLLGFIRLRSSLSNRIRVRRGGAIGAFLLGLLFGTVSTPCATPILVVLLTYLAASGSSLAFGAVLLFCYALGHSVLILISGISMGVVKQMIKSQRFARVNLWLQRGAGVLIICVGIFLFIYT